MNSLEEVLQVSISELYRIESDLSVKDFRIGEELFRQLLGESHQGQKRESFIVVHDGEYSNLALYIADESLHRARSFLQPCPEQDEEMRTQHLDGFCATTEGVSHFVYFTYCGSWQDRPVSQLELELQAEIDKFLLLLISSGGVGESLLEALFDRFELCEGLDESEQERYAVANREARRYAKWLQRRFQKGHGALALADARRLYRKPMAAKLEHIARAA